VIIPSQWVAGSSSYDIAIIRLPPGPQVFNFTTGASIANFPTSAPVFGNTLYAIAFGNQNPGGPTFPALKFTKVLTKRSALCAANLTSNGVTQKVNFTYDFCVQSQVNASGSFEGVCGKDIGGALTRTGDITNANSYYEVVGLISYANDVTTCSATNPVPIVASYLSVYQTGFFTPILGSLAAVGNKQNATANTKSANGNSICGNGIVEGNEECDPLPGVSAPCCSVTCVFRAVDSFCGANANTTCVSKLRCTSAGVCKTHTKQGKKCGKRQTCIAGVCKSGVSSA